MSAIDFDAVIPKFDAILSRGLCKGVGQQDGQMCIEAAICAALDLPHGDDPQCVHSAIRSFKIRLNDAKWSSAEARAAGLRRLGILQMGTDTGFDASRFVTELSIRTVREMLSNLLERLDPVRYATHATACRAATTRAEARSAARAVYAYAYAAAYAAADASAAAAADAYASASAAAAAAAAASAAAYADAYAAASAAAAADAAADAYADAYAAGRRKRLALSPDYYLLMSARIAEEILTDMQTPGAIWLASVEAK
jgi:hypothetical protein